VENKIVFTNDFKHILHHDLTLHTMIQIIGANSGSLEIVFKQTYETAIWNCLRTNYYGIKQLINELIPPLELSNSARIINVSSTLGQLKVQRYYISKSSHF